MKPHMSFFSFPIFSTFFKWKWNKIIKHPTHTGRMTDADDIRDVYPYFKSGKKIFFSERWMMSVYETL